MKLSCLSPSLPCIKPELLAEIAQALDADGSRLLIFPKPLAQHAQVFSYGLQPSSATPIEKNPLWQDIFNSQTTTIGRQPFAGVYPIDRICEHPILAPLSIAFATRGIRSLLILPLSDRNRCIGCLTLFRSGSSLPWTDDRLKLGQHLATDLYLAVMQQQVQQMFGDRAYYDILTALPHRLLLDRYLTLSLAKMPDDCKVLAAILIDLDRFKNINDSLGHQLGDRLLQLIAVRLKQTLAEPAIVGRWSGDEFAVIIPNLNDIIAVKAVADQVLNCFELPFEFEQNFQSLTTNTLSVKMRMGIAITTTGDCNSEQLIQQASIALDRSKHHGKNNYQIYAPIATRPPRDRLKLEQILDRAIIDRKLFLHYQPQIDIKTGTIIGIEALLRCQDAQAKTINPADFIPIAEETGSIIPIGKWVIRTACQQNKLWQQMGLGNFPIAVNFSVKQLQDPHLIDIISEILAETRVAPATLEVEITESIAIEDLDQTIAILASLRSLGVKISLDDFGTGYSSLAALKYLPLDRLKIDRSFIRELKANTIDASIVNTIVNLGHELNLNVVAEGVETIEQFELLRSINCDAVQGFFFSRPVTATALETMIINGSYWHQNLAHPHHKQLIVDS
jgi:diguanylate cyclase (GGDEF)-like protein